MNYDKLLTHLKRLQKVEPDRDFTQQSKLAILRTPPRLTLLALISEHIEFGASLALVGFIIFAFFGGFTGRDNTGPLEFTNLDVGGIKVEAEAIGIQIKLVEHTYQSSPPPTFQTTTAVFPPDITQSPIIPSGQLRTATPPFPVQASPSCKLESAMKALASIEGNTSLTDVERIERELEARKDLALETLDCSLEELRGVEKAFLDVAWKGDLEIQALATDTDRQIKKAYDVYAQNKEKILTFSVEEHKEFIKEFTAWQIASETPIKEKMRLFLVWSENQALFDAAERRLQQIALTLQILQLKDVPTISESLHQAEINLQYALTSHRSARHVFVSAYSPSDASYLIKASLNSLAKMYSVFLELDETVSAFSSHPSQ